MRSPKLVLVEWVDAYHLDEGWQGGFKPAFNDEPVWTVGFLINRGKKGVTIAQTWYEDDVANIVGIPARMINKLTILGELNGREENDGRRVRGSVVRGEVQPGANVEDDGGERETDL
jgi:hypothetical protein